ncbi:hypothetical protein [Hymenobacter edaphi]|uniref:Uncharacterized protein n=1 Tax=Hymenobacter edaphi TaxID=2211146 RepID=A0A328BQJ2_9BACT|nr:hypothetical protein [Hymenobacter edaphi]RAK68266.1 hypothetical protein DLM85_09565 [Hymenobacter edaphi]
MKSAILALAAFGLLGFTALAQQEPARPVVRIDDAVLKPALAKAITMTDMCGELYPHAQRVADVAALNDIDAQFVGRAAIWWNNTYDTDDDQRHFQRAFRVTDTLHLAHPDRIVQAGVMEFIASKSGGVLGSSNASNIKIPKWVWDA